MNRYIRRVTMLLASLVLGLALASLPAAARPLGPNGQISFDTGGDSGTVYTANQDGHHAFRLVPPSSCCGVWSPDGSQLSVSASTNDGRITSAIVKADGTGYRKLPIPAAGLNVGCSVWAPDGTHCAGEAWDDQNASLNGIYRVSVSDGSLIRVTSNPLGGHDIPGDYSPDGSQIVFGRYDANGTGIGLFIVNPNGTGLHQLASAILQPANDGDWSPQGDKIVFSRHVTADAPGSIWVIKSDGTGLRQITVTGLDCGGATGCHEPRWSPDGQKIIFAANLPGGAAIYTINTDGTGLTRVAAGDDPTWGTHPDVACTPTEKAQRKKALASFKRSMTAKRLAYFRKHHSAKARHAFVKRQRAQLNKLKTLVAACG